MGCWKASAAVVPLATGAIFLASHVGCDRMRSAHDKEVIRAAALMQISLPPTARSIRVHSAGAVGDQFAWLKFEMDPQDLEAFLAGTPFSGKKLTSGEHLFYHMGKGWWDSGATAQKYLFGETNIGLGQEVEMKVVMDNPQRYVVYLTYGEV